ncbi:MAG: carboxypeptidase-like regulatory domain-containing protein [Gemmatimonadota bacterium]
MSGLLASALLTGVRPLDAQPAVYTRVTGIVFDSVAMRPLAGALVQFAAVDDPTRARSVKSGDDGRFAFDSVPRGVYSIGFFHFRLDSVVPAPPQLTMVVRDSAPMTVPLGIPSAASLVVATCGGSADDLRGDAGRGLFSGTVRDAYRLPVGAGGQVRLQWSTLVVEAKSIRREPQSALARTDSVGRFAICGVPVGGRVTARAWVHGDTSGFAEFEIPASGYANRDLYVASAGERPGSIRGTVRNARNENVAGARVRLWGFDGEAVSNAAGQFSLDAPPSGTQTLELRALGYEP